MKGGWTLALSCTRKGYKAAIQGESKLTLFPLLEEKRADTQIARQRHIKLKVSINNSLETICGNLKPTKKEAIVFDLINVNQIITFWAPQDIIQKYILINREQIKFLRRVKIHKGARRLLCVHTMISLDFFSTFCRSDVLFIYFCWMYMFLQQ